MGILAVVKWVLVFTIFVLVPSLAEGFRLNYGRQSEVTEVKKSHVELSEAVHDQSTKKIKNELKLNVSPKQDDKANDTDEEDDVTEEDVNSDEYYSIFGFLSNHKKQGNVKIITSQKSEKIGKTPKTVKENSKDDEKSDENVNIESSEEKAGILLSKKINVTIKKESPKDNIAQKSKKIVDSESSKANIEQKSKKIADSDKIKKKDVQNTEAEKVQRQDTKRKITINPTVFQKSENIEKQKSNVENTPKPKTSKVIKIDENFKKEFVKTHLKEPFKQDTVTKDKKKTEIKDEQSPQKIAKTETKSPLKKITKNDTIKISSEKKDNEQIDKNTVKPKLLEIELTKIKKPEKESIKIKDTSKLKDQTIKDSPKPKTDEKIKTKTIAKPKEQKSEKGHGALSQRYFDRLYYSFPSFAPNYSRIEDGNCRAHGQIFLRQLKGSKLWAFQMLDSSAKVPSGILRGNLNQLGDFDQCLDVNTKMKLGESPKNIIHIKGKYCLAHIDIEAKSENLKLPVHLAQARGFIKSKYQDPGHFIPRFTTFNWGICLPNACDAGDAYKVLSDSLLPYNHSELSGLKFSVFVDDDDCFEKKHPMKLYDYTFETIATIGFYTLIVVVAAVATIRDLWSSAGIVEVQNKGERIFMSFSLQRTVSALFREENSSDEIQCIHGIRTICTLMLYLAHKLIPIANTPHTNRITLTELANSGWSSIFRSSIVYTDSFLLLSGVLTAYNMSRDLDTKGEIRWFGRHVSRFIRLTPALLATVLFYAFIFEYIGDGPQWGIIKRNAELCKESLWNNIFYIQNFFPFEDMCATHTHQLALDMQLTLLAPILVWFLHRKPLTGVALLVGLHAMSVGLRYYSTINNRLSIFIYHGMTMTQLYRTANKSYSLSLHRATPYLAGVSLGVILRQYGSSSQLPKLVSVGGWLTAAYFAGWTFYRPSHFAYRDYVYDITEAAQFSALTSVAWALALSWVIFACHAESEGLLNKILGSRPMVIFSRISYAVYLTQFAVFFYNAGTIRSASEFNIISSINVVELILIIVISLVVTLLLDLPMQEVKSCIMQSKSSVYLNKINENDIQAETENEETVLIANNNCTSMTSDLLES